MAEILLNMIGGEREGYCLLLLQSVETNAHWCFILTDKLCKISQTSLQLTLRKIKYSNFTHVEKIFSKRTIYMDFRKLHSKICGNCLQKISLPENNQKFRVFRNLI